MNEVRQGSHGEVLQHRPLCGKYGKVNPYYPGDPDIPEDGTAQCVDDRGHRGWCHDMAGHRLGSRSTLDKAIQGD